VKHLTSFINADMSGLDSSVGKTDSKKFKMFVGDSDLSNLVQAITTPQGAQIVSTQ
jgi:hypothetical protein